MPLPEFTIRAVDQDPDPIPYKTDNNMASSVRVDETTRTFLGNRNPPANITGLPSLGLRLRAGTGLGQRGGTGKRARAKEFLATLVVEQANGLRAERPFRKTVTIFTPEAYNDPALALGAVFPGELRFDVLGTPGVPGSDQVRVTVNFTVSADFPEVT